MFVALSIPAVAVSTEKRLIDSPAGTSAVWEYKPLVAEPPDGVVPSNPALVVVAPPSMVVTISSAHPPCCSIRPFRLASVSSQI